MKVDGLTLSLQASLFQQREVDVRRTAAPGEDPGQRGQIRADAARHHGRPERADERPFAQANLALPPLWTRPNNPIDAYKAASTDGATATEPADAEKPKQGDYAHAVGAFSAEGSFSFEASGTLETKNGQSFSFNVSFSYSFQMEAGSVAEGSVPGSEPPEAVALDVADEGGPTFPMTAPPIEVPEQEATGDEALAGEQAGGSYGAGAFVKHILQGLRELGMPRSGRPEAFPPGNAFGRWAGGPDQGQGTPLPPPPEQPEVVAQDTGRAAASYLRISSLTQISLQVAQTA